MTDSKIDNGTRLKVDCGGKGSRRGSIRVLRMDEEAAEVANERRNFEASFSSETTDVHRYGDIPGIGFVRFVEVLGHDEGEIDLSVINSGSAPVLDSHNRYDLKARVGVVESARVERGRGIAQSRLSKRDSLAELWQDISDGIISSTSVGYNVREFEYQGLNDNGEHVMRAVDWYPYEISLVSVPADASVGVGRSKNPESEDLKMSEANKNAPTPETKGERQDNPSAATAADISAERQRAASEATAAERQRIAGIHELCRKHHTEDLAAALIKDGADIDTARSQVLDKIAERQAKSETDGKRIEQGTDGNELRRAAMQNWLLFRCGYRGDDGRAPDTTDFRGYSLLEMARVCLESAGVRTHGMDKMSLAKRAIAHNTSDFPNIFENTLHKMLMAGFTAVPDKWRRFCAVGSVSDFRAHNRYALGAFSDIKAVKENGEYEEGTIPDGEKQSITAARKGRLLSITREMIINDDMGALGSIATAIGRGAARTVEKDVFDLLTSNSGLGPTLGDGLPLFHADHNNAVATSGAAPTAASVDAGRQLMASQTDPSGLEFLDTVPTIWLGPLSLGAQTRVLNASANDPANTSAQVPNPVNGIFDDVIDTARLTGAAWYMFANPADEPVLEVAFLDGQQTPLLEQDTPFETDGLRWKTRLEYGVAGVGYRGAFRNAGAGS